MHKTFGIWIDFYTNFEEQRHSFITIPRVEPEGLGDFNKDI